MSEIRPINERVAALEVRVTDLEDMREMLQRVEDTQRSILTELARYRGAWGMLLLVITALGATAGLTKDWIAGWIK